VVVGVFTHPRGSYNEGDLWQTVQIHVTLELLNEVERTAESFFVERTSFFGLFELVEPGEPVVVEIVDLHLDLP